LTGTNWYTIPGTLRDGQQVDLMPFLFAGDPHRLAPASEEKPRDMSAVFGGDERWRKYFENLQGGGNAHLFEPLGQYLCREWNAANLGTPAELQSLQVTYHWEQTLPGGERAPIQQMMQWEHRCFADAE
jgi:hypothetical protein